MLEKSLLSNGVVLGVVILGVIVVGGIIYLNKKSKSKHSFHTQEDIYKQHLVLINNCIRDKKWDILEEMLDSLIVEEFPDLKNKIEEALKNKN